MRFPRRSFAIATLLLASFLGLGSCGGGGFVGPVTGFWIYNDPVDLDGFPHPSHIVWVDDGIGPVIPVDIPPDTEVFEFWPDVYDIHVIYDDGGSERAKDPPGFITLYEGSEITLVFIY